MNMIDPIEQIAALALTAEELAVDDGIADGNRRWRIKLLAEQLQLLSASLRLQREAGHIDSGTGLRETVEDCLEPFEALLRGAAQHGYQTISCSAIRAVVDVIRPRLLHHAPGQREAGHPQEQGSISTPCNCTVHVHCPRCCGIGTYPWKGGWSCMECGKDFAAEAQPEQEQ